MSLEEIWSNYRENLRRFLHSKISSPEDIEDVLQDILIKTHRGIQSGAITNIKPWLYQIANNTVIDFYRKQGRQIDINQDDLWYGDDEESLRTELAQCIEPFLQNMSDNDAGLIRAIDLQGESQKKFAEKSGIPYSTLKSRVKKARKSLRGLFDQCCEYELDRQGNLISCKAHHKNYC